MSIQPPPFIVVTYFVFLAALGINLVIVRQRLTSHEYQDMSDAEIVENETVQKCGVMQVFIS